jgi:hypothetical protein
MYTVLYCTNKIQQHPGRGTGTTAGVLWGERHNSKKMNRVATETKTTTGEGEGPTVLVEVGIDAAALCDNLSHILGSNIMSSAKKSCDKSPLICNSSGGCGGAESKRVFERSYRMGPVLGKGGFGTVYAGVRTADRLGVAIKRVDRAKIKDWEQVRYR